MRIVIFCHSIVSDWNHGNAHFLRGIVTELMERGHDVRVYEPEDAWSLANLLRDHGDAGLDAFRATYPHLSSTTYDPGTLDVDAALAGADLVLVHEWNEPEVVKAIGDHRARHGHYVLLFHDTHHRSVTAPEEMRAFDLTHYDGVLAFGDAVRRVYEGWGHRAWTWHEAADVRVFKPLAAEEKDADLVWIGNWGDQERARELHEFLLDPVHRLGLTGTIHGVRYPPGAARRLKRAGLHYRGWLPNASVPEAFARHRVTVHVPRRPYAEKLPGIPTIRVFEALACGIPLVTAPWEDAECLFTPGEDYLVARDGDEMRRHLQALLDDPERARRLAEHGRRTILERHTCAHRVDELLAIRREIVGARTNGGAATAPATAAEGANGTSRAGASGARAQDGLTIAFFGSSITSSYWNGAATYYQGLVHALHKRGHRVTFYEPAIPERLRARDLPEELDWVDVVQYPVDAASARRALEQARGADVVVKASGVGVFDELLEKEVLDLRAKDTQVVYWDVDAPWTLDRMAKDPDDAFRACVPEYDLVLTYGGGDPVVRGYTSFGARQCVPVYNALDPETHHPVLPDPRFDADLAFLGNRLPDREARVEEFFLKAAAAVPDRRFILGGSGWEDKPMPANVRHIGHVGTRDHNAFNCTPLAVLNVSRASMASYGFSPATRVFEAAGAAACLITDHWEGIPEFLAPGREVLVAKDGDEVAALLADLTPERAREIGERARRRILGAHTYAHRAAQVEALLTGERAQVKEVVA